LTMKRELIVSYQFLDTICDVLFLFIRMRLFFYLKNIFEF
jgi:hypothetical protein